MYVCYIWLELQRQMTWIEKEYVNVSYKKNASYPWPGGWLLLQRLDFDLSGSEYMEYIDWNHKIVLRQAGPAVVTVSTFEDNHSWFVWPLSSWLYSMTNANLGCLLWTTRQINPSLRVVHCRGVQDIASACLKYSNHPSSLWTTRLIQLKIEVLLSTKISSPLQLNTIYPPFLLFFDSSTAVFVPKLSWISPNDCWIC